VLSRRNALIVVLVVIATGLGVWIASGALTHVSTVVTIDERDPAALTDPVDDDCPVGMACKVKSDLNVADTNQPASSLTSISPTAFQGIIGTSIDNGTVVGNTHVIVWWFPSGDCSVPLLKQKVDDTKDFLDGAIKGEFPHQPSDDDAPALLDPDVWPTRLESDLRVSQLLNGVQPNPHPHPVLRRSVAVLDGPGSLEIPVNLLSFDVSDGYGFGGLTLQGTYNVAVVGDPTSPLPGATCTPMTSTGLLLGRSAADLRLLTCEAEGTHTMTTVLTREVGGALVFDATVSDTVTCSIPVGGIQGYPDIAETVSGSSSLPSWALASAAAAGAVVLVGGAWYARRRWLS
jgi:hypothetical protein